MEESMTMAAGIRFDGGIMLCAESLYSGGDIKYSRTKIFTTRYEGGCTIFAMAGTKATLSWQCKKHKSGYRLRSDAAQLKPFAVSSRRL